MKYSIVTPVYNAKDYLVECIRSVIDQTHTDWELLLVDDGSTDGSADICDEFARKDDRIKVFHVENGGPYRARLLAVDHMTGDYTIGLDSDDIYMPDMLAQIDSIAAQNKVDMVVVGYKRICAKDDGGYAEESEELPIKGYTDSPKDILLSTILCGHSLGNKAVRTEIAKRAKYIDSPHRLSMAEDLFQAVPMVLEVSSAYFHNEPLYAYRMRTDSSTHKLKTEHIFELDWIYGELAGYLRSECDLDRDVYIALLNDYAYTATRQIDEAVESHMLSAKDAKAIREMSLFNDISKNIEEIHIDGNSKILVKCIAKGYFGKKALTVRTIRRLGICRKRILGKFKK